MEEVVIVGAKRSAIGSFGGSLKDMGAKDLASIVLKDVLRDVDKEAVDSVIIGNVLSAGLGQNVARQVLLDVGIKQEANAFSVNQVCGSGLKAVELAYQSIAMGANECVASGGTESMSNAPYILEKGVRFGYKMSNKTLIDSMIHDGLWCASNDYHMGITAENIAKKYNISRQEQDEFSLHSQQKATKALLEHAFHNEITPIVLKDRKGEREFIEDEFVRKDCNGDMLAKLKPAFDKNGSVTAGNASGINDGAAMLLLCSKQSATSMGLPILARIKGFASVGVEPSIMGIGAAFAAQKLLKKQNLSIDDIDIIEANEAFASQSIAVLKELKAKSDRVNIHGGAIALGHPIGASGARILTTLLYALRANKKSLGLATLCVGGGQGIACIIEAQ